MGHAVRHGSPCEPHLRSQAGNLGQEEATHIGDAGRFGPCRCRLVADADGIRKGKRKPGILLLQLINSLA
jgi:hypothetical protein